MRRWFLLAAACLTLLVNGMAVAKVEFVEQKLDNGLRVIYAPMPNSPVVHVRVLYLVGSRDERPDRQGFAHMFEHMMFRGSKHVLPEQHMKLISLVGGSSNAFTSFDQTTYVNTLPAAQLELALWLEADRMASFKVSDEIYRIERNVVAKEWGIRQNQPYGAMYEDFLALAYSTHSYRWTPIGNMAHLRAAPVSELQEFFNRYYVPANACLVIAGGIDVEAARAMVAKYFGWMAKAPEVKREIPEEPPQVEPRRRELTRRVPLATVIAGWKTVPYAGDDHDALTLLDGVLGDGRTSRINRLLVHTENPQAQAAWASNFQLVDTGIFFVGARVLPGKDVAEVEKQLMQAVQRVVDEPVKREELDKIRRSLRIQSIRYLETASNVAAALAEAAVFGGDPARVNTWLAKLEAVTPEDVQRVARKYLKPEAVSVLIYRPGMPPRDAENAADMEAAPVAESTTVVEPRPAVFPEGYPTHPPMAPTAFTRAFEKGQSIDVHGTQVIVMTDRSIPLVSFGLTMRQGSHILPPGRSPIGSMAAALLRRGAAGVSFHELNEDLETRGISVEVSDGGDFTRIGGSALSEDAGHMIMRARQILRQPDFPADEFAKLKTQSIASLKTALANPSTVAERELEHHIYGDSPLGVQPTLEALEAITLDDVKAFYAEVYRPDNAILIFSGDIDVESARKLADELLSGWAAAGKPAAAKYELPPPAEKRQILLVDNPDGKQSVIRVGMRAYSLRDDDKFAGSLAGQILSAGIDSRLGRYVRAEKGFAYSVWAFFGPQRHGGDFTGGMEVAFENTSAAIEAMYSVLNTMRSEPVTEVELSDAKNRVTGGMVMGMQTIAQQAGRRVEGILNGYEIDYYDKYPARVAHVTSKDIQDVMQRFVHPDRMTIVVAAPAAKVKEQLEKLGEVKVMPMPLDAK